MHALILILSQTGEKLLRYRKLCKDIIGCCYSKYKDEHNNATLCPTVLILIPYDDENWLKAVTLQTSCFVFVF